MAKLAYLALLILFVGAAGCASDSGSKEYIPGKGWRNARTSSTPPLQAQAQALAQTTPTPR